MNEQVVAQDIPPLSAHSGMSGKLRIMGLAFVCLFFAALFGVIVWRWTKANQAERLDEELPAAQLTTENRDTDLKAPPAFVSGALVNRGNGGSQLGESGAANTDAAEPNGMTDSDLPPPPAAGGPASQERQLSDAEKEAADHKARRQQAPVLAFSRTAPSLANGMGKNAEETAAEPDPYQAMMAAALSASTSSNGSGTAPAAQPQQASLNQQLKSEARAPALASRATNRSFMVRQATMGRCTMRTAFNSQLSGFASCILSDPLYSADGRFVMAEAGSEVLGEYQTGQVKTGISRAFVLWTSIETPHGVKISLDSPATDSMGQSGISGRVNNHFWKRFGSGLLLSVVDDAASQVGKDTMDYRATSQSMNQAAAIAVQANVEIPPTITVKAGAVVNIFVARDLDFSTVYSVRLAGAAVD